MSDSWSLSQCHNYVTEPGQRDTDDGVLCSEPFRGQQQGRKRRTKIETMSHPQLLPSPTGAINEHNHTDLVVQMRTHTSEDVTASGETANL